MNSTQFDELTAKSGIYPNFLTKEEKADIKSALLEHLKQGGFLPSYLNNLQIINAYPEVDPHKEIIPVTDMIETIFFQSVLKMQEEIKKMPELQGQALLQQCLETQTQAFDENDWFYLALFVLALSEVKKSCSADFSVSIRSALSMYLLNDATSNDDVADNS